MSATKWRFWGTLWFLDFLITFLIHSSDSFMQSPCLYASPWSDTLLTASPKQPSRRFDSKPKSRQSHVTTMSNAININWMSSPEGESLLHYFYDSSTKRRRSYGILEKPALASSIEEVTYKIFMIGRPGAGKTSVVNRLAGVVGDNDVYSETNGIRKTTIFWPVKIWDKVCKDKVDAVCSVFSFDDAASFRDIPYLMNSIGGSMENPAKIVIGTKYQAYTTMIVLDSQVKEFEERWKTTVIKIDTNKAPARSEILDCSNHMNSICKALWNRDQDFIFKQIIQV